MTKIKPQEFSGKKFKKDEPPEELWCHCYATCFVKYPPLIHYHPEWIDFMKKYVFPLTKRPDQ